MNGTVNKGIKKMKGNNEDWSINRQGSKKGI